MVKHNIKTFFDDNMDILKFIQKLGEVYPHLPQTTKENPVLDKINGQISDILAKVIRSLLDSPLAINTVPDEQLVHIFLDKDGARCKTLEQAAYVVTFPNSASTLMKIFDLAYKKEKLVVESAEVIKMNREPKEPVARRLKDLK